MVVSMSTVYDLARAHSLLIIFSVLVFLRGLSSPCCICGGLTGSTLSRFKQFVLTGAQAHRWQVAGKKSHSALICVVFLVIYIQYNISFC